MFGDTIFLWKSNDFAKLSLVLVLAVMEATELAYNGVQVPISNRHYKTGSGPKEFQFGAGVLV